MTFVVILIVLVAVWAFFGDRISAWLRAQMMGRMEDQVRRAMGMPSRKEEKKMRKEAQKAASRNGGADPYTRSARNPHHHRPDSIIPKEYAEDVEFVEYKSFSKSEEVHANPDGSADVKVEEQVSDVEFTEIKPSRN